MKACLTEALRYNSEDRHLAVNLETTKWELADAEKELKWLKSAVTSSDKEYEQIQRKTEDMRKELENERWVVFLMLVWCRASGYMSSIMNIRSWDVENNWVQQRVIAGTYWSRSLFQHTHQVIRGFLSCHCLRISSWTNFFLKFRLYQCFVNPEMKERS